jgi:subtilisin family serine protease
MWHRPCKSLFVSFFLLPGAATATDYALLAREDADAAGRRGATIVHDYGAVAWVAGSGRGNEAAQVYALELGGRRFDPAADAAARADAYGSGKALRLVQFDGPIKPAWLDALAADGVTVVQYIAPFSYVVWADATALATAKSHGGALRYRGDFLPSYKTASVRTGLARGERQWQAMLYRGAQLDAATLRATGAIVGTPVPMDRRFDVVGVQGDAAAIDALARLPGVYAIEPVQRDGGLRGELTAQIAAHNLGADQRPVPGYLGWLADRGANGNGVTVAVVDGGIFDTHPDLAQRMRPCVGDTCGGATTHPHGTHVAGIVAGDGSSGTRDAGGFLRGLGVAPGVRLVEQLNLPTMNEPGGLLKLMRQSHDNGADLSTNSWGFSQQPVGYDIATRQIDAGVRDTKPDVPGDQPMPYVLAIANRFGGTGAAQGSPDGAKNTITVASTKGQTSPGVADPAIGDLAFNSGAGPTPDGRRVPHLVAPGCLVDSTISATGHGLDCGTSMATPHVAGAAALFIERYRASHAGATPSAALIKAALVATAQDLYGNRDANDAALGHRPDDKQGWGRLRTDQLTGTTPTLYYDQNTRRFDGTGETWFANVAQADPTQPVRIVLAYTDAPGHGLGGDTPAWNNDLDLSVSIGAAQYRGNVFGADGWSATGGTTDPRNNLEAVMFDAPTLAGGAFTIRVTAADIPSDALPNVGDDTDQDFALVCINCVARPDYTLTIPEPQQSLCTTQTTSAQFGVAVGSVLGYASPVSFTLDGVPAGATGAVSPAQTTPPGDVTVALGQLGAVPPGTYTLPLRAASASATREWPLTLTLANALPAAPALAAPANDADDVDFMPTFTWSASAQAADYLLEVAKDPAFANIVLTRSGRNIDATPANALDSRTRYWWRVRAANVCGSGDVSAVRSFRTRATPADCPDGTVASTVFGDDVENGASGWTAQTSIGDAGWTISTARATSGSHAWLAPDPETASRQHLTSPRIALPAGTGPLTLQFMSDQTIDSDAGACYDGGFLEVSTDDGETFDAIPPSAMLTDPYDGELLSTNPDEGAQAWCGDPQTWLRSVVDLDAWAGRAVRLRFVMTSGEVGDRLPHGWYVDDIRVQACRATPVDAIFADGFD